MFFRMNENLIEWKMIVRLSGDSMHAVYNNGGFGNCLFSKE